MKRKMYDYLVEWKKRTNGTSALLVQGARRVGKSYIVEEFAKAEYKSYILIDFNKADEAVKDIFLHDLDIFIGMQAVSCFFRRRCGHCFPAMLMMFFLVRRILRIV